MKKLDIILILLVINYPLAIFYRMFNDPSIQLGEGFFSNLYVLLQILLTTPLYWFAGILFSAFIISLIFDNSEHIPKPAVYYFIVLVTCILGLLFWRKINNKMRVILTLSLSIVLNLLSIESFYYASAV